jgi:hypothetical protein
LQVVRAMQETVKNMVGTLPPQFFTVTISAMGDTLAQLMHSVLLTGYMFRNAQYRMELRGSLSGPAAPPAAAAAAAGALPSSTSGSGAAARSGSGGLLSTIANFRFGVSGALGGGGGVCSSSSSTGSSLQAARPGSSAASSGTGAGAASARALALSSSSSSSSSSSDGEGEEESAYAPGVQKSGVEGQVLRWHKGNGLERTPAAQYIEMLEQELLALRQQARAAAAAAPVRQVGRLALLLGAARWGARPQGVAMAALPLSRAWAVQAAGGWPRPRRPAAAAQPAAGAAGLCPPPLTPVLPCSARVRSWSRTWSCLST